MAYKIWVGVDWGSQTHQVCAISAERQVLDERIVDHRGEALAAWVEELLAQTDGDASAIAVAIETPRSAVVETLLDRGVDVYAINPKQLDRFRDRHTVAGAKDDRRDAFVAADALRTDQPSFRKVRLGSAELVVLREVSRTYDELALETTAFGNRIGEQLRRFYPQILELGSVHTDRWLWELLEIAPTPEQARHVSRGKAAALLKRYRIRTVDAARVLEVLRAKPLHVAPGVAEACAEHVTMLLARLRLAHAQQQRCRERLDEILEQLAEPSGSEINEHRDARILRSMVGMGTLVSAAMLSEAWQPLEDRDYPRLRLLCGVAPVTVQTGKRRGSHKPISLQVKMRYACNGRLRQALFHWARASVRYDERSRLHYAELRVKGQSAARALRGVADRLLAVLVAMLRSGSLYDPSRRLSRTSVSEPDSRSSTSEAAA